MTRGAKNKKKWPCLWIMQACKGGRGLYPMFTSLKRPNRYTKCTKKTRNKQTLCRLRRMSTNIKTSRFLDFLLLTWHWINRCLISSERSQQQKEKKEPQKLKKKKKSYHRHFCWGKTNFTIFRLRATNVLKVHCLWEWFFIKRWSVSLFLPSHGNLLPETEHGKPKKSS